MMICQHQGQTGKMYGKCLIKRTKIWQRHSMSSPLRQLVSFVTLSLTAQRRTVGKRPNFIKIAFAPIVLFVVERVPVHVKLLFQPCITAR